MTRGQIWKCQFFHAWHRRLIGLAATGLTIVGLTACETAAHANAVALTGGDPARASQAFHKYGCVTCHTIPGIDGADGLVGPPLTRLGARVYLAGQLPNTPDNLVKWIRHPQQVVPGNVMPEMGVTDRDARDLAAYLYTLQ